MQSGTGAKGMALHVLYWVVLVLAVAPLAYYLLSLYCVVAYFLALRNSRSPADCFTPPASILKPVRGVDREAYENFASYCRLDYPAGCVQLLFGALDAADPALELVRRLQK